MTRNSDEGIWPQRPVRVRDANDAVLLCDEHSTVGCPGDSRGPRQAGEEPLLIEARGRVGGGTPGRPREADTCQPRGHPGLKPPRRAHPTESSNSPELVEVKATVARS